ncbi:MAG: restriction endonuclease, partial [Ahniella sp.]|nr:restriction endonuclease [Ahniella sp.]
AQLLPNVLSQVQNPILRNLGQQQLATGNLRSVFWLIASPFAIAAILSFISRKNRQNSSRHKQDFRSLRAMNWRELEQLVSEAYRRSGYQVQETGQAGADGGIDLILKRDDQTKLVQCKHRRTQRVGATHSARTVRTPDAPSRNNRHHRGPPETSHQKQDPSAEGKTDRLDCRPRFAGAGSISATGIPAPCSRSDSNHGSEANSTTAATRSAIVSTLPGTHGQTCGSADPEHVPWMLAFS